MPIVNEMWPMKFLHTLLHAGQNFTDVGQLRNLDNRGLGCELHFHKERSRILTTTTTATRIHWKICILHRLFFVGRRSYCGSVRWSQISQIWRFFSSFKKKKKKKVHQREKNPILQQYEDHHFFVNALRGCVFFKAAEFEKKGVEKKKKK